MRLPDKHYESRDQESKMNHGRWGAPFTRCCLVIPGTRYTTVVGEPKQNAPSEDGALPTVQG